MKTGDTLILEIWKYNYVTGTYLPYQERKCWVAGVTKKRIFVREHPELTQRLQFDKKGRQRTNLEVGLAFMYKLKL